MNSYEQKYEERYHLLNVNQRLAVDTTEGPVMVIAGPGTGKTEVLGMRIANLLRSEAQIAPHEILCLTYTEEAAHNMRKRLSSIVGLAAQKVNIHTFHGFCNNIIQSNSEYFGLRQMDLVSDLERVELMQDLLAKLPPQHPMHRVGNSTFYDLKPLNNFFNEMKKENWSAEDIINAIAAYLEDLPNREQYIYKKKTKTNNPGDIKQKELDAETDRMQRSIAAANLYNAYNNKMLEIGRYDFADMILWVIDAFKKNSFLLQHYQERYQYILVDEFQDTNGAQNEILNMLTSYWGEDANIFVVGDDDQSIYEFQGARIKNIVEFYEKYKTNIEVIVLTENYRSSQPVLDRAMKSIVNNKHRLLNALENVSLTKDIVSSLPRFLTEDIPEPVVTAYYNPMHEGVAIVKEIEALAAQGTSLDNVAILYAQHKQADNIIALLERKKLPYTIRRNVNVLDELIPRQVLKIFEYLAQENKKAFSAEPLLFELLHAPYFGIEPNDIAILSLFLAGKEAKEKNIKHWRQLFAHEMILSTMELKSLKQILKTARLLDNWLQQLQVLRMPMLLEKIVYDSGIVDWCLQGEHAVWEMQVLQTFFAFVQSNSTPQTSLRQFLEIIEKMISEGIQLSLQKLVQQDKGVQLFTAHSAKGLEFEYVYLIGCTKDFWEKKSGGNSGIKFPDTLTRTVDEQDGDYKIEVARRVFYVAITRAKKHLYVSFAQQKDDGKPLEPSVFVEEIISDERPVKRFVETPDFINELALMMKPVDDVYLKLVDEQLMQKQLENFALSASSLSKYLRCPVQFYYEDVLRTPVSENDSMAFGTAVHYALERAFQEMLKVPDKSFPPVEEMLSYFRYKMRDKELAFTQLQYERRLQLGVDILTEYYSDNVAGWNKDVQLEKWLPANIGAVPIKGKIDKIELLPENQCRVVDYKTGKPDSPHTRENLAAPNDKNNMLGGDYWRQMVFYKLLIENQPFNKLNVGEGVFEYIEKGKAGTYTHKIFILPSDEEVVRKQIEISYRQIKNYEFEEGCGKEDCKWCNFARDNKATVID
ncbi:MAG: ATP-dependent DNA helicase [Chitinophagaceae bacterium]|jgi:DNA helicase-2/ATP-dependent DNA helicase PcrA